MKTKEAVSINNVEVKVVDDDESKDDLGLISSEKSEEKISGTSIFSFALIYVVF